MASPTEKKIQEIQIQLQRIEDQVGRLVADADSEKDVRKRIHEDFDKRIRSIENWQNKWAGALVTLGVIATILSLVTFISRFF